jgi:hypothetical protein
MSKYEARIYPNGYAFWACIVRIDKDGEESVIHGYKARSFKTRKAAERSTGKYIEKIKGTK